MDCVVIMFACPCMCIPKINSHSHAGDPFLNSYMCYILFGERHEILCAEGYHLVLFIFVVTSSPY